MVFGIGQEAIAGVTAYIMMSIYTYASKFRVFTGRNIPLYRLFRNGKVKPTVLRKAEIEVFILERNNIKIRMISHLGPN
jgi:hypothetical protein